MPNTDKTGSSYEQPAILDSFEELDVLGDARGIGMAACGSQLCGNEV